MKLCASCKNFKEFNQFHKNKATSDGLTYRCKGCVSIGAANWYKKNRARFLVNAKKWNQVNKIKVRGYVSKNASKNKARLQNNALMRKFGINKDIFNKMLLMQGGSCKICKVIKTETLCVDHDHKTGKIRGLLCRTCNTSLGLMKESIENFKSAIEYLTHSQSLSSEILNV